MWDDHEFANNAWMGGAQNHNPERGEGDWWARRRAAARAYYEWMPIREDVPALNPRIYRAFMFGDLASLLMLDTRLIGRDLQSARTDGRTPESARAIDPGARAGSVAGRGAGHLGP